MPSFEKRLFGLTLLCRCGGGAYGDVYLCTDASGKKMALKVVSKERLGNGWEREFKGIMNYRKLTEETHGLLRIIQVGEDEQCFYYTMEAADPLAGTEAYAADTLAARLARGPLPPEELIPILTSILEAISSLHTAGFAHRDIKPENILFVNGAPKLADLGLLSPLTGTMTQLAGTLDFLPPEARSGDSRSSRQGNDFYAFGKLIYCCVTGKAANEFPSTPTAMPLTLQNKLFFRLSLHLCDKEADRRLTGLEALTREFHETIRMCRYGESLTDKMKYALASSARQAIHATKRTGRALGRHWLASLACLLVLVAFAWFLSKKLPGAPYDIANQATREYANSQLGIAMDVPVEWEVLSSDAATKLFSGLSDDETLSEQEKKQAEFLTQIVALGCDYIICDYSETFFDNITIQSVPVPGEELMQLSDEELRLGIQQLFSGEFGFETRIYEMKRTTLAGHECLFIDLSHEPGKTRVNNYLFPFEDSCLGIAMTAKDATFHELREKFNAVLGTLRFTKGDDMQKP